MYKVTVFNTNGHIEFSKTLSSEEITMKIQKRSIVFRTTYGDVVLATPANRTVIEYYTET